MGNGDIPGDQGSPADGMAPVLAWEPLRGGNGDVPPQGQFMPRPEATPGSHPGTSQGNQCSQ